MSMASALRSYEDPREAVADCSARIIRRYSGSRRIKIVPMGEGFSVLIDGNPVAKIDARNSDEAKIRELIDGHLSCN